MAYAVDGGEKVSGNKTIEILASKICLTVRRTEMVGGSQFCLRVEFKCKCIKIDTQKVQVHNNSYCAQRILLRVLQADLRFIGIVLAFTSINNKIFPTKL